MCLIEDLSYVFNWGIEGSTICLNKYVFNWGIEDLTTCLSMCLIEN